MRLWAEVSSLFLQLLTHVYLHILPSPSPSAYYIFIYPPIFRSPRVFYLQYRRVPAFIVASSSRPFIPTVLTTLFVTVRTSPTSPALAWIWNAQDWTFDPASKTTCVSRGYSAMIYMLTYSPPADSFGIQRRRTATATAAQIFDAHGPNLPGSLVQHMVEELMRLYAGGGLAVVVVTGKKYS